MLSRGCLDSNRVRFHESVGHYSQDEEEHKHVHNRVKYKKFPGKDDKKDQAPQVPDVKIMVNMRRFVKEVNIKGTDPLVAQPYNKYALIDAAEKKKFQNDIDISKHYALSQKKTMVLYPKMILQLQPSFFRNPKAQQNQVVNFKDLAQVKNAIKNTAVKSK